MDEPTNERPEGPAEKSSVTNFSLGLVFAVIGITLFITVDTPWAGVPMAGVGVFYIAKSVRDARRERALPGEAPDA
jgi:hypothetical protein